MADRWSKWGSLFSRNASKTLEVFTSIDLVYHQTSAWRTHPPGRSPLSNELDIHAGSQPLTQPPKTPFLQKFHCNSTFAQTIKPLCWNKFLEKSKLHLQHIWSSYCNLTFVIFYGYFSYGQDRKVNLRSTRRVESFNKEKKTETETYAWSRSPVQW